MNQIDKVVSGIHIRHKSFRVKEVIEHCVEYAAADKISWDIHYIGIQARRRFEDILQPSYSPVINKLFGCHKGHLR